MSYCDKDTTICHPPSLEQKNKNIFSKAQNGHCTSCPCGSSSIFSGNDELVEFFLPKLGMACTCGKNPEVFSDTTVTDLTAIEFILRPWQCRFLKSFNIHRGDQLVKANHRSAPAIARAMKKWRRKHEMVTARTVSCGLALHIWSRVCKIYVRSIRRQILLDADFVKIPNPTRVLSTLLSGDERRVSVPFSVGNTTQEVFEDDSCVEV